MSDKHHSKPVKEFRAGGIRASIWRNDAKNNGRTATKYSVRLQRRFRKKDGNYDNTDYFFPDDLPRLTLVAQKACAYVALTESKEPDEAPPI